MDTRPLILYHAQCPDGFTAAWCAALALSGNADLHVDGTVPYAVIFEKAVELLPVSYGSEPPDVLGREVWIVDFSYKRECLIEMAADAKRLTVIDHHKTAEEDLRDLPFCTFDMDRSGAGLAWDLLCAPSCETDRRPWIVDYVEDRDLWRFRLPDSRLISDVIMATPYNLSSWSLLASRDRREVVNAGRAIRMKIDSYCESMMMNVRIAEFRDLAIYNGMFPVVNAPQIMISDLLHLMLMKDERAALAMGWFQRGDGRYQFSLRAREDFDVSTIARAFGGGGHRAAAGFQGYFSPNDLLLFPTGL